MKRLINFLMGKPRVVVVDVQGFGPRMTMEELLSALKGAEAQSWYRAVMQVLEFQRQMNQAAVEDKSNVAAGQTGFEAGGAAGVAEVMRTLADLQRGESKDAYLNAWFPRAKSKAAD